MISIEEMTPEDIPEILAIQQDSFPTPWTESLLRQELGSPLSRNLLALLGLERAGAIAGYVNFWVFAGEVHLHHIAVRRDLRRRGIASALLKAMIVKSQNEGVSWATLEFRSSNGAARNFYEKFGFREKGVRRLYYQDTGEDAVIMAVEVQDCLKVIQNA
jgi:[ribosomal protein S18]-alanine N-acetyltransferase